MRFKPTRSRVSGANRSSGFTLAEVLAALLFMAIVIPTAVHGLRIANLAGTVGLRKAAAARIAEQVLNELVVTGQWRNGATSGSVLDDVVDYEWAMRSEPWSQQTVLRLITVQVTFPVQEREFDVRLSTVVDTSMQ